MSKTENNIQEDKTLWYEYVIFGAFVIFALIGIFATAAGISSVFRIRKEIKEQEEIIKELELISSFVEIYQRINELEEDTYQEDRKQKMVMLDIVDYLEVGYANIEKEDCFDIGTEEEECYPYTERGLKKIEK